MNEFEALYETILDRKKIRKKEVIPLIFLTKDWKRS